LDQKKREGRDEMVQKYGPKIAVLQERIRKAQQSVEIQAAQANQQNMQTALSIGTTLHLWEEELWVHLITEQDLQSVELADR